MEIMAMKAFWKGRKVFMTGHTGFKGGWLSIWLRELGADVHGFALPAPDAPALWHEAALAEYISGDFADLRDSGAVAAALQGFQPEIVLHLAAQPLVRKSYCSPLDTYAVNFMGTAHVLEALRHCPSVKAVVVVTTDKCYSNREWRWPYREQDALGGVDPYSNSKACVELLCASYRDSFLRPVGVALATARAGNVLGGGDWAAERLLPDVFRAWQNLQSVDLRYPQATRPWQHVLEPLLGYLMLARALYEGGDQYASAWNFGPDSAGTATVESIVRRLAEKWPTASPWSVSNDIHAHEAGLLALDSSKARHDLGWLPRWTLEEALDHTLAWQLAWMAGQDMLAFTRKQIMLYQGNTL